VAVGPLQPLNSGDASRRHNLNVQIR
jgi:hypothetical protein